MIKKIWVVAAGGPTPRERSTRKIGPDKPVQVGLTPYYVKRLRKGELRQVDPKEPRAAAPKPTKPIQEVPLTQEPEIILNDIPVELAISTVQEAIEAGEVVRTGADQGKPTVEALENRLSLRDLNKAGRDAAYDAWLKAQEGDNNE